ncbi:hypothetical protein GCM10027185_09810 [Spirosoma pulveris]
MSFAQNIKRKRVAVTDLKCCLFFRNDKVAGVGLISTYMDYDCRLYKKRIANNPFDLPLTNAYTVLQGTYHA